MVTRSRRLKNPRALGVACAATATVLGLLYLSAAGAPSVYLAVNALSLVLGLALFAAFSSTALASKLSGGVLVALGSLLLATALFGVSVEGASRWIRVAGLSLQISLVVLPAMLVAFARRRGLLATIGMILAAVALALQPDRAMAGVLAAALAVLAMYRRDRWVVSTLAVAVAGFATTLMRPDLLPAVPYVDRILYTSFQVHPLAGLAVAGGALLLIVPAIAGQWMDPENRDVHAVFGAVWLGVVAAAALGNYPTPLVGYGGSAILGYALSLAFTPGRARSAMVVGARPEDGASAARVEPPNLRLGVEPGSQRMRSYFHRAVLVAVVTIVTAACASVQPDTSPPRQSYREGRGRAVVMLGGGVYGAAMFAPHARDLARDYDVIRVQTLNIQQAETAQPMPSDYSISAEASAVHQTLLALGVTGPVDVIGSSFGAVVALRLATLVPGRVRSLVLFEPPAFWALSSGELEADPEAREMRSFSSRMSGASEPTDEDLHRFRCILGTCPPAIPGPSDPERAAWDRSRLALRGLAAVAAHRERPDAIRQLRVPTLLINGTSTVRFHRRINEVLSTLLPDVRVAQIPGTHGASRTSQTEFLAVTREFLAASHPVSKEP